MEDVIVECGACGITTTISSDSDGLIDLVKYCPICGAEAEEDK